MTVGMFMEKAWAEILDYLDLERKKYGGSTLLDKVYLHATGKGFRFPDDATAEKIRDRFRERVQEMADRDRLIDDAISNLKQEFSQDDWSCGYADRAINSLRSLKQLNKSAMEYAENYANKIDRAIQLKRSEEEEIGDSLDRKNPQD